MGSFSNVHPQRLPLGGLPVIWCCEALSSACQYILPDILPGVGRFSEIVPAFGKNFSLDGDASRATSWSVDHVRCRPAKADIQQ
jgi:hypothetical protein